jgi:FkbM family methyltransferase
LLVKLIIILSYLNNMLHSLKLVIKKFIPRKWIVFAFDTYTYLLVLIYHLKLKTLIIRKGTSDWEVFKAIFARRELNLPVKLEPKLIIDAGAYTGLSTLYFASKYPLAKVIAVEPEQSNFDILLRHTQEISRIKCIKAGLWNHNAFLKVVDRGLDKWGFGVREASADEEYDVQAVTIKHLLKESNLDKIDILKLDIEGSEKQIFLEGYEEWLPKVDVIIIELHDFLIEGCSDALYSAINIDDWVEYKKGEKVVLIRKYLVHESF